MKLLIPSSLRSYTSDVSGGSSSGMWAHAEGVTLGELLLDLDRRHPGIRFRMVDEQEQLRPHMRVFVNGKAVRQLSQPLCPSDEVAIVQALSGG